MVNQAQKEKILLKTLKNSVSTLDPIDDPFGDKQLFDEQVTAYFLVKKAKARIDPNAKHKFRLIVNTSMFGGSKKHLNILEWEKQKEQFNLS
jgi:hypothetical protein